MSGFTIFLLIVICGVLTWRLYRIRTILRDLSEAVTHKTPYLQSTESNIVKRFKIDYLIQTYSELQYQERKMRDLELQMQNQIEAVLGKIQEAVYSIDLNNIIIHANKSASDTFNNGKPIRGKRIEELIRDPEFLDCAHMAKSGQPINNHELQLTIDDKTRWFEVSATPISKSSSSPYGSVLFVFHDISRLKELEIVKNNFVANVSHELKTPITIVQGFTETLIDDNDSVDPATRLKFLKKIESNTTRLNLIVKDLLTLSRIESEPEFIKKTRTEIGPMLSSIQDNYSNLVKGSQKLEYLPVEKEVFAQIDALKISQVFQNLLDNAIRYSGEGSTISFTASLNSDTDTLECKVWDSGKGIPGEDLPNIFRRFYRVDKARSRAHGGTGLGLSIARGIVEHHGGNIRAENIPDGGLCISFSIPAQ